VRAMVQTGFGGPDVVHLRHIPDPVPAPGEVVLRVEACALNSLDVLQRRGPGLLPGFSLPHIAGMDVAGSIVSLGTDVQTVAEGDRVLVDPTAGCGICLRCLAGDGGYCAHVRVIGGNVPGGLAEYVAVPAAHLVRVPAGVDLTSAAALPTAFSTAWHAVHGVGRLAAGECLVVQAASSAISVAAIQLAKRAGAYVIAVAGTEQKLATATRAGADLTVRHDADIAAAVGEFTKGRGAELVLDHVGVATWGSSLASLAIGGRLVMLGNTSGDRVSFSLADVFHRGLQLLGAGAYRAQDFTAAMTACFENGMRSVLAAEFELEDLESAWIAQESRDVVGKVVVHP